MAFHDMMKKSIDVPFDGMDYPTARQALDAVAAWCAHEGFAFAAAGTTEDGDPLVTIDGTACVVLRRSSYAGTYSVTCREL